MEQEHKESSAFQPALIVRQPPKKDTKLTRDDSGIFSASPSPLTPSRTLSPFPGTTLMMSTLPEMMDGGTGSKQESPADSAKLGAAGAGNATATTPTADEAPTPGEQQRRRNLADLGPVSKCS